MSKSRAPTSVWIGLAVAIALDTLVQLVWKSTVLRTPESDTMLATLFDTLRQPLAAAIVALFILQFLNWMFVLSRADLSYAQPLTALSYVSVSIASAMIFHEQIPPTRIAGIALILGGVWLISGTGHRTQVPSPIHAAQIDVTEEIS